jgi:hypothetical protein
MKKKIKGKQSPFFFASETDSEKPKYTHRYPTRMNDFYKSFSDGDPRKNPYELVTDFQGPRI